MMTNRMAEAFHDKITAFYKANPTLVETPWLELTGDEQALVTELIDSGMKQFNSNERDRREHKPGAARPRGHPGRKRRGTALAKKELVNSQKGE